jgi:hypothetical protein
MKFLDDCLIRELQLGQSIDDIVVGHGLLVQGRTVYRMKAWVRLGSCCRSAAEVLIRSGPPKTVRKYESTQCPEAVTRECLTGTAEPSGISVTCDIASRMTSAV